MFRTWTLAASPDDRAIGGPPVVAGGGVEMQAANGIIDAASAASLVRVIRIALPHNPKLGWW